MTHYKPQVWLHVSPKAKISQQEGARWVYSHFFLGLLSLSELFLASCGMGLCSKLCKEWQFPLFSIKIEELKCVLNLRGANWAGFEGPKGLPGHLHKVISRGAQGSATFWRTKKILWMKNFPAPCVTLFPWEWWFLAPRNREMFPPAHSHLGLLKWPKSLLCFGTNTSRKSRNWKRWKELGGTERPGELRAHRSRCFSKSCPVLSWKKAKLGKGAVFANHFWGLRFWSMALAVPSHKCPNLIEDPWENCPKKGFFPQLKSTKMQFETGLLSSWDTTEREKAAGKHKSCSGDKYPWSFWEKTPVSA